MTISGKIVNESNAGIPNLDVTVFHVLFGVEQADSKTTTDASGNYSLTVEPSALLVSYYLRVTRGALVELYQSDSHQAVAGHDWAVPDITLHSQYITGWIVRDPTTGAASMLSDQNLVELHVDNERAWTELCTAIQGAQSQVHIQQYYYQVGKLIMEFTGSSTPDSPPATTPTPGLRLEDLLKDAHDNRNVDVQVICRDVTYLGISITSPGFALVTMLPIVSDVEIAYALSKLDDIGTCLSSILGGALVLGPVVGVLGGLILLIFPAITNALSTGQMVSDYFTPLADAHMKVKKFPCDFFHPLHAKYVIIDNASVHITASPFMNAFFSTQDHWIKDYRYGNSVMRKPVHDVSGRLMGPLMQFIRDSYDRYWNKNGDPATFPNPVVTPQTGSNTASIQVNRTIYEGTFTDIPKGEQGILQSYLRAIDAATDYIYLENQYFTEEKIYNALVEKIKNSADVQLIVLVNIDMDIPGYNNTQRNRINALTTALAGKESQFGFFTVWSQEKPSGVMNLVNTYIHSKVAVIDDKWATFGSANLDGYSMRAQGEHDLNVVVFNDVDGLAASDFPSQMRNKLWNEHLFSLDQDNTNVIARPATGGWLSLWTQKAQEKLDSINSLGAPVASRVLKWAGFDKGEKYLKNGLGVANFTDTQIKVWDKVPEIYDFVKGTWGGQPLVSV